jgi:Holliday junction resolvase RusA-like endonuclease
MIAFHVVCVPPKTTHQAKKIRRVGKWSSIGDKPELVEAKAMLDSLLLPNQPAEPIVGAVSMVLAFTWPWLASHSKKTRALGRIPHTSRPDASNCAKTIEDRLVALRFIGDDNAVVDLHVTKWWGNKPGIDVRIEAIAERQPHRPTLQEAAATVMELFTDSPEAPTPRPSLADG